MYNNELKLFQRSNNSLIWTDDYISKSMLEVHINKNIKPNSKILDLGCGPGLYAYMNWAKWGIMYWGFILIKPLWIMHKKINP